MSKSNLSEIETSGETLGTIEAKEENEASRQLGINCTNICKCCRGERMKTKGFIFKYKEKEGKI